MYKYELIKVLADKMNLSISKSESVVNHIFRSMSDVLQKGERIELRGFGSFSIRQYNSYLGRNPMTGTSIVVKPKKLPLFKVSKQLKQRLNGNGN